MVEVVPELDASGNNDRIQRARNSRRRFITPNCSVLRADVASAQQLKVASHG